MNELPNLIRDNGEPFESSLIKDLNIALDSLGDIDRTNYRDKNALAIAQHKANRLLIISGPGTGKSRLFIDRIKYWYTQDTSAKIAVTSFVAKLVADLQVDISNDIKLTDEQKKTISVSTLHKLARSIVEKNHGTSEWKLKPHFEIIDKDYMRMVWNDVIESCSLDAYKFTLKCFEGQLHNSNFDESDEWKNIKNEYFNLCGFYNAAGFSDLIIRAKDALKENSRLINANYFIIDEYQDFNRAEEELINEMLIKLKGVLIVGDDEQVLYNDLKSSKPDLIRFLYRDTSYANCMLPYCSRSDFYIAKTTADFISKQRSEDSIEKIYLPIKSNDKGHKVQIIACTTPASAINYIKEFVTSNKDDIDQRKENLISGAEKDAFLLILTPKNGAAFYNKKYKEELLKITSEYKSEIRQNSSDYEKLLCYYYLAENASNNFKFRKVINHEDKLNYKASFYIKEAMKNDINFCDLNFDEIKNLIQKCSKIKKILDSCDPIEQIITEISEYIAINDRTCLIREIRSQPFGNNELINDHNENVELDEIGVKKMGAIELLSITGSKGLSADHVIIIGFDDVNMKYITPNAFNVAMTRARKSLHLITSLKSGGATQAHKFLELLPHENLEFYSNKKNGGKTLLAGKDDFIGYLTNANAATKKRRG